MEDSEEVQQGKIKGAKELEDLLLESDATRSNAVRGDEENNGGTVVCSPLLTATTVSAMFSDLEEICLIATFRRLLCYCVVLIEKSRWSGQNEEASDEVRCCRQSWGGPIKARGSSALF